MPKKRKHGEYDSWCTVCGMPLTKAQIAAILDDTDVMDFSERQYVTFSAHFCEECWKKMVMNNLGKMDAAMKKLENLEKLQQEGCAR